ADGVAYPVDEGEQAVRATDPGIPGVEPQVAPGIQRLLGRAEVARHEAEGHLRPDHDLAHLAVGHRHVGLRIDDARLEMIIVDPARSAGGRLPEPAPYRNVAFGHAEARHHVRNAESLAERP